MKTLFCYTLLSVYCIVPSFGQKAKKYKIAGKIENAANVYIYLKPGYGPNYGDTDSVWSKDGSFNFSGEVKEPVFKSLYVQGQRLGVAFVLEPGEIKFKGISTDMNNVEVKGGIENEIYNIYREAGKDARREYTAITAALKQYREAGDSVRYKEYHEKWMNWGEKQKAAHEAFVKKYPGSFAALAVCRSIFGEPEFVGKLLGYLDKSIHENRIYKEVRYRTDVEMRIGLNKPAPDFAQPLPDGSFFHLSSLKGKYVLLDFWASWCVPCRKLSPEMVNLYQQFSNKGFEMVSISLDSEKAKWLEAVQKDNYTWINASDLKGYNCEAASLYGVSTIPRNFLLDKEGKIIAMDLKMDELTKKLELIFKRN